MDETALIALGILMEETAREVLGETGDLAFIEEATEREMMEFAGDFQNRKRGDGETTDESDEEEVDESEDEEQSTTSGSVASTYSSDVE